MILIASGPHFIAHKVHTWQYCKFETLAFLSFIVQINPPFGQISLQFPHPIHFSVSTSIFKIISP